MNVKAYLAHADPCLCEIYEQAVLRPFPCALGFFRGEIGAVLAEVYLHNQGHAARRQSQVHSSIF